MEAAQVKTVDLKTLMPFKSRNRKDWAGMALSYIGTPLEMWGQLRLLRLNRGGSIDVTFVNVPDRRSTVRNAVWLMPANGEALIALGNLDSTPAKATVKFSDGEIREVEIRGFGTEFIRRNTAGASGKSAGQPEAVQITADGGNVIPAGAVSSQIGRAHV